MAFFILGMGSEKQPNYLHIQKYFFAHAHNKQSDVVFIIIINMSFSSGGGVLFQRVRLPMLKEAHGIQ